MQQVDTAKEALRVATNAQETANQALSASGGLQPLLIGAGLALAAAFVMWWIDRFMKNLEAKEQRGALTYAFTFEALQVFKHMIDYYHAVAYRKAISSDGFELLPNTEVARLIALNADEKTLEAVYTIREKNSALPRHLRDLSEGEILDCQAEMERKNSNGGKNPDSYTIPTFYHSAAGRYCVFVEKNHATLLSSFEELLKASRGTPWETKAAALKEQLPAIDTKHNEAEKYLEKRPLSPIPV